MRTFQRLILCVIYLAPRLAAQAWPVDSTRLNALAQDSTGQVWGINVAVNSSLYRWEGDKWNSVAVHGVTSNYRASALANGPEGAVYCLWSAGEGDHAVTWHNGTDSKTLAHFSGDLANRPNIFVDPNKNIWVTERGIHIYRITPEGQAECVYTIEYDHRYDSNLPRNGRLNFPAVFATADGQGRIWFWSGGPGGGGGVPSLEGVLIFDGKNFDLHPNTPGAPVKRFSAVEPEDADHMWLAAAREHLYRVDINTLIPEVVPDPAPNAFRSVERIFHAGGATYLVSADGSMPVAERNGEGRFGALWRLQGGEWKRVINGLDMRTEVSTDPPRPFLVTPEGLWLGAYGTGPWFVPAGPGEPVHIDWRYGYSLGGSEGLMALPDGRLLFVAAAVGSTAVKPADLLAAFQSPPEVRTLNPLRALVPDRHNHIWGFLSGDSKVISEWDGKTWTDHVLPEDIDHSRSWNFGVDSQDRIWLLNDRCQGAVTLLDPPSGKVENYPDFSAALQAQLPNRASFHVQGNLLLDPTFTSDGRIGYRDGCAQAHYFNGQAWQMWRSQEIDAAQRGSFDGPPFFDRAGNFAINIAGRTWEYTQTEGWRITAYDKGFGTDQEILVPHSPPPPPGCEVNNPESVAQDRLGTYWLTSRGQLYRAIPGLCVPQFSSQERQPFADSRLIKTVLIDPEGNAFLETYFRPHPNMGEYVILNVRPPLPQAKVRAVVETSGIVKLRFETQVKGKLWFIWRVDDGAWTSPSESAETTLDWLPNGQHLIAATALDERLQMDPTPATAEVTIHVDSQKRIATLIEQLKDPDYAVRDAAVDALVHQPALALPLLQSAREKAGADQRWWIDAAIQQIADSPPANKKP
jgi:streptogramin lyase